MQTNQEVRKLAQDYLQRRGILDYSHTVITDQRDVTMSELMAEFASHLQPEAPADGYYKVVAGVMTKLIGADEGVLFNAEGPISPTNDKFDPTSGDRG